MKMKKSVLAGVLTGAALLSGGVMASVASADVADLPTPGSGVNVGNDACIAPWMWNGPGTAGISGQSQSYSACTGGSEVADAEGSGFGNDACILPWNWNGPFNFALTDNHSEYAACE